MSDREPVDTTPVPQSVQEGLEEVRTSGVCNMLDWICVQYQLQRLGRRDDVEWIRRNRDAYARFILGRIRNVI